jgi:hypothetical protein
VALTPKQEQYMRHLGFKRVRSKTFACYVGWGKPIEHAWAVLWDGGRWTYPPKEDLEIIDDKLVLQES